MTDSPLPPFLRMALRTFSPLAPSGLRGRWLREWEGEMAHWWNRAIRKRGLRFLATFHHGFAWRYYEPAYGFDAADPKGGLRASRNWR